MWYNVTQSSIIYPPINFPRIQSALSQTPYSEFIREMKNVNKNVNEEWLNILLCWVTKFSSSFAKSKKLADKDYSTQKNRKCQTKKSIWNTWRNHSKYFTAELKNVSICKGTWSINKISMNKIIFAHEMRFSKVFSDVCILYSISDYAFDLGLILSHIPFLGLRDVLLSNFGGMSVFPQGSRWKLRTKLQIADFTSVNAKRIPIQFLGPWPKGWKA